MNTINSGDVADLLRWGHAWGKAISLPPTRENIETIQAGPDALRNAVDYYAMCTNDQEKRKVLFWFEEGVRQHADTGSMQLRAMFEDIIKNYR